MANIIVTSDTTLHVLEQGGYTEADVLYIRQGAVVTIDRSPQVLLGRVDIDEGVLRVDGANAADPIVIAGAESQIVTVRGAGTFETTPAWWYAPVNTNGSANQAVDISSYFASSPLNADYIPGVWVETGRRINYTNGSGVPPKVGDWIFSVADNGKMGRVTSVSGDGVTGYVVVQFFTGTISDGEALEIHSVQDNQGPEYQISWTASANGIDVLEPDVWTAFANTFQGGSSRMSSMGPGIDGFGFVNPFGSTTLTFGDGVNGMIPPAGARVRLPMVHFTSSTPALFAAGNSNSNATRSSRYGLDTTGGGDTFFRGVGLGAVDFESALGGLFEATDVAAATGLGVYSTTFRVKYSNCIIVSDPTHSNRSSSGTLPSIYNLSSGADVTDIFCLLIGTVTNMTAIGLPRSCIGGVVMKRIFVQMVESAGNCRLLRSTDVEIDDFVIIGTPVAINGAQNCTIKNLKTQRNLDQSLGGSDQVILSGGANDTTLIGWEILNHSSPADSKISISESNNVRIRGFHFFDRPYDGSANPTGGQDEEFISTSGIIDGIDVARCHQINQGVSQFALVTSGTTKNVVVQNCTADPSREAEPDGINTSFRGYFGAAGNLGSAIETDYTGSSGGDVWDIFPSETTGKIVLTFKGPSNEEPIEILSGAPKYTRDGDVDAPAGTQWIVESQYAIRGHIGFTGEFTSSQGGGSVADGTDEWPALDMELQYDVGSGYNGTWIDVRDPAALQAVPNMAAGVRLKFRLTATANGVDYNGATLSTFTDTATRRANMYPIDQVEASLKLTGLQPDTNVAIFRASDNTLLADQQNLAGGVFEYNYVHTGVDIPVNVSILSFTHKPVFFENIELTAAGLSIPVSQVLDRQYENP